MVAPLGDAAAVAADHTVMINAKVSMRYICRFFGRSFYDFSSSRVSTLKSGGYKFKRPVCAKRRDSLTDGPELTPADSAQIVVRLRCLKNEWLDAFNRTRIFQELAVTSTAYCTDSFVRSLLDHETPHQHTKPPCRARASTSSLTV